MTRGADFNVGDKVTVRTCSGDYPAIIRKIKAWPFSDDIAYEAYGDNCQLISTVRTPLKRISDKVKQYSTCHICDSDDCCFREKEYIN